MAVRQAARKCAGAYIRQSPNDVSSDGWGGSPQVEHMGGARSQMHLPARSRPSGNLQFRVMRRSTRAGDCNGGPLLDRIGEIFESASSTRENRRSSWRRRRPDEQVGIALCVSFATEKQQQKDDIETDHPSVRHVKTFDGERCAVPLRIGHYWIQTLFSAHALASYDISDLAHIREVSRVTLDDKQKPHWIAADADSRRVVLNSGEYGEHRLFIVNFDSQTGALKLDEHFGDPGSDRAGVSMDSKSWPHGFHGDAYPHGTVFSRPTAAVKSASLRD